MAADGENLSATTIANPRLWRLGMLLDMEAGMLTVAATSTVGEEAMLCRRIALAQGVEPIRALEDAVYDNPMLLADFDRTTILLRTPRYAVVPAELAADADSLDAAASLLWTAPDAPMRVMAAPAAGTDAAVMLACDADVASFLGRTFADARVCHALVPEIAYFASKAPRSGNAPKLFAVADGDGGVDLMAFDGSRLLGATSYAACAATADMAYYAAAAAQVCGVAGPELQFYVAGPPAARDALAGALREFAPHVMPWVFPSGLFADGVAVDTPFPLIILPLCE